MTTLVGESDLVYHEDDPRVVPLLPEEDHSGDAAVRIDSVTKVFTRPARQGRRRWTTSACRWLPASSSACWVPPGAGSPPC